MGGINICCSQLTTQICVFQRAQFDIRQHRRVICRNDINQYRCRRYTAIPVIHCDRELIGTRRIRIGCVGERAVGIHDHRPVRRLVPLIGAKRKTQRIVFRIRSANRPIERRVFLNRDRLGLFRNDRRIVNRRNVDRYRRCPCGAFIIADFNNKAVRPKEIGVRRIGERPIGVHRDHTILRCVSGLGAQRICQSGVVIIDIRSNQLAVELRVLGRACFDICQRWRVVRRLDRDKDSCLLCGRNSVADRHRKTILT